MWADAGAGGSSGSRRALADAAHLSMAGPGGRPRTLTSGVPGAVASGANPNVPRLPLTPGHGGRWVPLPFSSAQMPRSGDPWPGNCSQGIACWARSHFMSPPPPSQPQRWGPAETSRGCVACWGWGPAWPHVTGWPRGPGLWPSRRLAPPCAVAGVQGLLASAGHGRGPQVPPPDAPKRGQHAESTHPTWGKRRPAPGSAWARPPCRGAGCDGT